MGDNVESCKSWRKPADNLGALIPNLWSLVDAQVQSKCANSSGDSFTVTIPWQNVSGNGFVINGIKLFYSSAEKVAVDLTFKKDASGNFKVWNAQFRFSQPLLAAFNVKIDGGKALGALITTGLNEKAMTTLFSEACIEGYDPSLCGPLLKSAMVAIDRFNFSFRKEDGHWVPQLTLALGAKQYLDKGWGIFTFGVYKKEDCITKTDQGRSDHYDNSKCRTVSAGPRIGQAMLTWLRKDKTFSQEYRKKSEGRDELLAMVSGTNVAIKGQPVQSSCDRACLEKKQAEVVSEYLRWKKSSAEAK